MGTKKRVRNPKKGEQVGADFDEYTIYDQGPVPGGPKAGAGKTYKLKLLLKVLLK